MMSNAVSLTKKYTTTCSLVFAVASLNFLPKVVLQVLCHHESYLRNYCFIHAFSGIIKVKGKIDCVLY